MTLTSADLTTLQTLVATGKAARPDLASRIERALVVVLFREIEPLRDGYYSIAAERAHYTASRQSCTCPDGQQRGGLCKHQLAVGLIERLDEAQRAEEAAILAHFSRPAYANAAD